MSDLLLVEAILYERKVGGLKNSSIIQSNFIISLSYKPYQGAFKLSVLI